MTRVFCTFRVAGFHYWPEAPPQYAYLAAPHRHMFHVRVEVAVAKSRQVEFIELRNIAEKEFIGLGDEQRYGAVCFGARSCEILCAELWSKLVDMQLSVRTIEVSEDGENGAVISGTFF